MTDTSEVYWYGKIFRWLFATLDKIVYGLVSFITDIFNIIAGTEIRTAGIINNFFGRIQIILGVIILFKLVISFFSGIVDPDGIANDKKGVGNVIKRVIVVLIMILLIVPLNIPESDTAKLEDSKENSQKTWNARMNESGILFGTLSELQSRILRGNVITKLILGNDGSGDGDGDDIALTILKSFVHINLIPGAEDPTDESNWLCPTDEYENSDAEDEDAKMVTQILNDEDVPLKIVTIKENGKSTSVFGSIFSTKTGDVEVKEVTDNHTKNELKRDLILNSINYKCDLVDGANGERYIFVYQYFLSTVAGVIAFILFLSLTIDVAIRVFKLLVLRILAPIAILSYIDPKSEKSFNNWVKSLATTFLDLFIRVAIISFVMMLIKIIPDLLVWNTYTDSSIGTFTILFARLILIFGLLFFAKEAPKFISQTLGIDSKDSGGLFSGIGKMMKGIVTPIAGAAGGFATGRASYKASLRASEENTEGSSHSFPNKAKAIASGIFNGIGATVGTASDYAKAKDNNWRTAMDKVNKSNAYRLQNAEEGSTWWGQKKDQLRQDFLGDSEYSRLKRKEKDLKDKQQEYNRGAELLKKLDSAVESEVTKKGLQTRLKAGNKSLNTNVKDIDAALELGKTTGDYSMGGYRFANRNELDKSFKNAASNGSAKNGYDFAGYHYDSYSEMAKDYASALANNNTVAGVSFTASQFGAARADAIDYAKNTVYEGTAKFSNGAEYGATSTIKNMIPDVVATMDRMRNDDVEYQKYMSAPDTKNKVYDENKDMVTNIKNMRDFMDSAEYSKGRDIGALQEQIGKAKGNFHGNDGGQGGH